MVVKDTLQVCAKLPSPVLTVYLNTSGTDASRHPRRKSGIAWFLDSASDLQRSLPHADAKRCERQVRRVGRFLENRRPAERSLVIFAGANAWQVVPLKTQVANDISWGEPKIASLLAILHSHRRYAAVVIDHSAARFFELSCGELNLVDTRDFAIDTSEWKRKEQGSVTAERVQKSRGPLRDLYEHRVAAQYKRLCHEIARQAAELCGKEQLDGLFLVGPDRLTQTVLQKIPQHLATSTVLVSENFGGLSPKQLQPRLEPLVEVHEQDRQLAAVERLQSSELGALTNPDEVLAQLQKGAIRFLLVANDLKLTLRDCPKCGFASAAADPVCADCGARRRKITLEELLARVLSLRSVGVEFVNGKATELLERTGGLGGWLPGSRAAAAM